LSVSPEEFKPENYKDEYRIRVLAMPDEKSKSKETVIDIMEALKRSMERIPAKKKRLQLGRLLRRKVELRRLVRTEVETGVCHSASKYALSASIARKVDN
jgi:hypothetical protein